MTGEAASLTVKITGDASELERSIRSVEKELSNLEKRQTQAAGSTNKSKKATADNASEISKSTTARKNNKKAVSETSKAVEADTKAAKDNSKAAKGTKKSTEEISQAKKAEAKAVTESSRAVEKSNQSYNDNIKTTAKAKQETEKAAKSYKQANDTIDKLQTAQEKASFSAVGEKIKSTGEAVDKVTKPLQNMALVTAAGGVAAAKFAIDFEDNFANVKKTVDGTPEELAAVRQGIIDLSTSTPTSTKELTELAAAGGQLGIETPNIIKFTETMAQLGTATNLYGESGAQTLARFMNVTNTSQDDVGRLGSSIVDLGNNFATTESEIASMALNMGATGSVVNISAQDVLGYATALSSMGIEAEAGGSAVSRIWMEMQTAVSSGGKDLGKFAKLSGKSSKEFKKQWKEDASGAFQDFLKGLNESEDQVKVLSDLGFNNIRDIQALQRLAGEKGFNILTEAIGRSNKAWQENTALQNEFNAKNETTAAQLSMTKNNVVEAARSIGETMLPAISKGSTKVKEFAQKINQMNDSQKETLVSTGATVIGLGAGFTMFGKVATGVGAVMKVLPALVNPVGLAIAGVAAATGIGVAAYNKYKDATENYGQRAEEAAEKAKKANDSFEELNDKSWEFKQLNLQLNQEGLSEEETAGITSRMEELAAWFKENYNIELTVSGADEVIAKNNEVLASIERLSRADKELKVYDLSDQLSKDRGHYEDRKSEKQNLESKVESEKKYANSLDNARQKLLPLASEMKTLEERYKSGSISVEAYNEDQRKLIESTGEIYDSIPNIGESLKKNLVDLDAETLKQTIDNLEQYKTEQDNLISSSENRIKEIDEANKKFEASAKELVDFDLSIIGDKTANGEDSSVQVSDIADKVKLLGLSATEYAQKIALAKSGQESFNDVAAAGDYVLDNYIQNYINSGKELGATAQDLTVGASLLQEGFTSVDDAAKAGALDKVFANLQGFGAQLNVPAQEIAKIAQELNIIPEGKHIEITAEGDISLVEDVKEATMEIDGEQVTVRINDEGDIELLDEAKNQIGLLEDMGAVSLSVNAEGNIELLDEAGNVIATIDGKTANMTVNAEDNASEKLEGAQETAAEINGTPITVRINTDGSVELLNEAKENITFLEGVGDVSVRVTPEGNFEIINSLQEKVAEIKKDSGEIKIEPKFEANGNILDGIKNFLSPKAEAAEIEVKATADTTQAESDISKLEQTDNNDVKIPVSAEDNATGVLQEVQAAVSSLQGVNAEINISASDNASSVIQSAQSGVEALSGVSADININATDNASGVASAVQSSVSAIPADHSTALNATDNVSWQANTATGAVNAVPTSHNTDLTAVDNASAAANSVADAVSKIPSSKTVTINIETTGTLPKAKGTQDFEGGLAMINDQKGIPDPRELVEVNGKHYMFEGRDVILPLPKHAKVYPAKTTQRILKEVGIPQYAKGKDVPPEHFFGHEPVVTQWKIPGSFITGYRGYKKDEWQDPTDAIINRINLVQQLDEEEIERMNTLIELRKAERDYAKAAELSTGKIKAQQERAEELKIANERLKGAIEDVENASGYDTSTWFDELGNETTEYFDLLNKSGKETQEAMKKVASGVGALTKEIIDNEKEIFTLTKDTIEAQNELGDIIMDNVDNIADINDHKGFLAEKNGSPGTTIDYLTKNQEEYHNAAETLRQMGYGEDSPELMKLKEDWWKAEEEKNGIWEDINSKILESRKKGRDNWKKIRDTYDDWEVYNDSLPDYYQRIIEDTEAAWKAGIYNNNGGYEAYRDDLLDATLNMYTAQREQIQKQYEDKIQGLEDNWMLTDRDEQIRELRQKEIDYSGAVTARGKEAYKDYNKQLRELQREEQKYLLQQEQKQALDDLKNYYTANEANRSGVLENMRVNTAEIAQRTSEFIGYVQDLANAVINQNIANSTSETANDNRQDNRQVTITVNGGDTAEIEALIRKYFKELSGQASFNQFS